MGVCVWDFVMIIIIVFVYFFDSTCCVTWESIGIFFCFRLWNVSQPWWVGLFARVRVVSFSREKMSAQKSERDRLMSFFVLVMMCVLVLVRGWNQTESVQNGGACFGFECVCLLCLEKLSSRLYFQPFSFSHVFLFTLISRVV